MKIKINVNKNLKCNINLMPKVFVAFMETIIKRYFLPDNYLFSKNF